MQDNNDMYASEAESAAVIQTDKRTAAEKRLDAMLEARGANEQGADSVAILRGIAVELIGQPAAAPPGWRLVPVEPTAEMIHAVRFAGDPDRPAIGERIAAGETTYPYVGADVALRMCRAILNAAPSDHIPNAGKMVLDTPAHCEAGPDFCPQCHKESQPTYGSEEVRKLRETIASLAQIVNTLQIELVAAQPRPFVGLSEAERVAIEEDNSLDTIGALFDAVESALRAKNEVK